MEIVSFLVNHFDEEIHMKFFFSKLPFWFMFLMYDIVCMVNTCFLELKEETKEDCNFEIVMTYFLYYGVFLLILG